MSASQSFQSETFQASDDLVEIFCQHFDGNPVHWKGCSNEILPEGTVPGMMIASMSAKTVLKLPAFKDILCARTASIRFVSPAFRNQHFFVRGTYEDSPHRSREGVIFRAIQCEVICVESQKIVISYEMTQLLRDQKKS